MAIPEKFLKFKFHFIFAALFPLIVLFLFLVVPRFLTIVSYFWPLFVSTALFLVAIVFFGMNSMTESEIFSEKAGEEIIDYVAGKPDQVEEPLKSE